MINVSELARRLSIAVGRSGSDARGSRTRFTTEEVLTHLGPQDDEALVAERRSDRELLEMNAMLANLPRIVVEERLTKRHPGFSRYFESLPRIIFLYGRGESPDSIAKQMHFIATGFGVESILQIVAGAVARRLNHA